MGADGDLWSNGWKPPMLHPTRTSMSSDRHVPKRSRLRAKAACLRRSSSSWFMHSWVGAM